MTEEFRILAPTAILGYGFPSDSFRAGLDAAPHLIAVDAGSTDPGPYYLGAGVSFTDRAAVKRDLALTLEAALARRIPLVIGSAGGAGARPHLEWTRGILLEVAREQAARFQLATIDAEVNRDLVAGALAGGRLTPLDFDTQLTPAVRESTHIVAQMGAGPLIAALSGGAEVVLAGRCYDPAVFAALPLLLGFDPGLALHMGKILECAAIACDPGSGSDCLLGGLGRNSFWLRPTNPARRCTVASVAAHTLYEKSDPVRLPGPGGILDLSHCRFEQLDELTVRVSGSRYIPQPYTLKLEGARLAGYRAISIAGARDPLFIEQIDSIAEGVRRRVSDNFQSLSPDSYRLLFRFYGRDAVLDGPQPPPLVSPPELGVVIEAVARSQEIADTICSFARSTMLHFGYPGRLATAGNLAFPYSPSDFSAGEVYEFSVYHLLRVDDPLELFPIRFESVEPA